MAVYDGDRLAREHLIDVAKLCIQATLKAPQITGRLKISTKIVTDDDLMPVVDVIGELAKIAHYAHWDHQTFLQTLDDKDLPLLLLIGADLTVSDLKLNCGACGFKTCADFNRYAKKMKDSQPIVRGPSCNWKMLDFSIACDWACAAAWQYNVENRILGSAGLAAQFLGLMPGCSTVMGLPLGPPRELVWYSREAMHNRFTHEDFRQLMLRTVPTHFMSFSGTGKPLAKDRDSWWSDKPPRYFQPVEDPEYEQRKRKVFKNIREIVQKYKNKKK
jgi:uncharacterized ferredoxin-like protein